MFESYAVHKHPHFRDACAEVLNEEWPRSKSARLLSLNKSADDLPYNIALVEQNNNSTEQLVVGHSRLSKVHGKSAACFIESVVIAKNRRGQGLGRKLMEETEKHASNLGFTTLYLTTHDQQKFYEHMGYSYCKPVITLGSATKLLSPEKLAKLLGNTDQPDVNHKKSESANTTSKLHKNTPGSNHNGNAKESINETAQKTTKTPLPVSGGPPPPPVSAPPPPAPPPPKMKLDSKTKPQVQRMNPADISWMKKVLS